MPPVPKSPIALVFALYKVWRRLPPAQRQQVLRAAQRHGPRMARAAAQAAQTARKARGRV